MRSKCALGILALVSLLTVPTLAMAQSWPGRHGGHYGGYGGYGYGGDGAWGLYSSAMNNATSRNVAEANRMMGQQAAMQQSAMIQNQSRNMLASQAQARTDSQMSQRQSDRDWWFQAQQQQMSQNRRADAAYAAGPAPAVGFEAATFAGQTPRAATDVIPWLPVLCDPRFAAQRAIVEAPYRRQPKSNPTVADYQSMIVAAGQMKAILGQMTAEISAQEYLGAEKFLDQLATEASARIAADKAAQ
jgi:hypothetical protein